MKKLKESLDKLNNHLYDGLHDEYWNCIKQYISLTEEALVVLVGKERVDTFRGIFEKDFEDDK